MRIATCTRTTKETDIALTLGLDGTGIAQVNTGIGFLDHMLTALAVHSRFDLTVTCRGDLQVDGHHTAEDIGIVLGQAFREAAGSREGITRYGTALIPMDEALARAVVDVSGRPFLVFDACFDRPQIGTLDTQLIEEFWRAFAMHAGVTLHLHVLYGKNDHHQAEALFKAAAHALHMAVSPSGEVGALSTKGVL